MSELQASPQTAVTKLSGKIDNVPEKHIPTSGSNDRGRIMNWWSPIFKEIAEFARTTQKQNHLNMRVWANPQQTRGHDYSVFYYTQNMCDPAEGREEVSIFGITLGIGNRNQETSADAFVADLQIRFFTSYATITTWHVKYQNQQFGMVLEKFLKTTMFPRDLTLEEEVIEKILSGTGAETEMKIHLKQGLLFAAYWQQMITPMLH